MKIIIIRDEDEELVEVDHSFDNGTLTINFSPDFIGSSLEVLDYDPKNFSTENFKIYLPD